MRSVNRSQGVYFEFGVAKLFQVVIIVLEHGIFNSNNNTCINCSLLDGGMCIHKKSYYHIHILDVQNASPHLAPKIIRSFHFSCVFFYSN